MSLRSNEKKQFQYVQAKPYEGIMTGSSRVRTKWTNWTTSETPNNAIYE
jgi:hypothetical protein